MPGPISERAIENVLDVLERQSGVSELELGQAAGAEGLESSVRRRGRQAIEELRKRGYDVFARRGRNGDGYTLVAQKDGAEHEYPEGPHGVTIQRRVLGSGG